MRSLWQNLPGQFWVSQTFCHDSWRQNTRSGQGSRGNWQARVQVKCHISISRLVSISKSISKSDLDPGACSYNCNVTHHHHHPENFLSKGPSINSLIYFYKRCVSARKVICCTVLDSTAQYSMILYGTLQYCTVLPLKTLLSLVLFTNYQ